MNTPKKKKFPFKMEFPKQSELKEQAFLDLRNLAKQDLKELSKSIGTGVRNKRDLKKHLKFDIIKNTGKVGYMVKKADGGTQFVILDSQYLFSKSYRTVIDRTGFRPVYLRKVLSSKGKTISLDKEIKKVKKLIPLGRYMGNTKDSYMKSLVLIKEKIPLDYTKVKKSIERITEEGNRVGSKVSSSVNEGIRQAILDKKSSELSGKLCRMTGTAAENPDLGHALLEWKIMPCDEVLEHLQRFGCQHDFEVMN